MQWSLTSGCRKRWATFIGGLASFDVIFSTVGRRTVVGGARVVRRRPAGRSAGRPAGRPGGARVVRGEKKNAGGPGGGSPPAKPVKGGVWGGEAPPAKIRGVWAAAPPSQNRKFFENFSKFLTFYEIYFL